jgi:ribonucleoside-diphosphate reductase beta chain
MNEIKKRKIFNEHGNDSVESRSVINGDATGILNFNSVKYGWAVTLYKIMVGNHWLPEKISLVDDKVTIKELTKDELSAFKNTLSFLIALDSMQVSNLPSLADYITAPEINALFTVQGFFELIHSQSYQTILQELFPSVEREEIYNYWRTNPLLLKRNKFIANQYQKFIDNKTLENFKIAIAADFALEGIYFYNGFQFFYQLASRNKVANVAKMIKYIDNDEVTHVNMYVNIIRETFDLNNEADKEIIIYNIREAAEQEIEWSKEIYGDRILGISQKSSEDYIKYLANQRLKLLHIKPIYPGFSKNPYEYLNTGKRENFFETKVTEYSQSTAVPGWNDF